MSAVEYLQGLPFAPDRFQLEAAHAIDRDETVVVSAPTGAGKTVVAEAAIARAGRRGERVMYTTPLKALSNQKFGDFRSRYGAEAVGLLTGDNSINGGARVVVMTTEVLRNMMYAGSPDLADVGTVVLDEVHYLQDRERGPVWEEIIIHLDPGVRLVCLSATIANGPEFAAWVQERRGPTSLVVEQERPVPLSSEYLLRDRWERGRLRLLPIFEEDRGGRANPRLVSMLRRRGGADRYAAPRRSEACRLLAGEGLLPAIYFIFSRAGCAAAARQVVERGLRLTTTEEAARIRQVAEERTAHLSPADLGVLGYGTWLETLQAGVAPHHAGLVPAFKETVEHLFSAGLVRLVFATETLSLGINMPARSVVLESLYRFGGEQHEVLQPGDYTQLTGRAGRRGIDRRGTAVVLHSLHLPFERVAAIAAAGAHPLRSSFRPTYNMAANLMAGHPRLEAERLLNASFAQFHEARLAGEVDALIRREEARLEADREAARCERGDVWSLADEKTSGHDRVMSAFAATTASGDVLAWPAQGGREVREVVVARGHGPRPRLLSIAADGSLHRRSPDKLPAEVAVVGRLDLPEPFRIREPAYRREVAGLLRDWEPGDAEPRPAHSRGEPSAGGASSCPDLPAHLAAVRSARRREARLKDLHRRRRGQGAGMVPRLRAIADLLERWGYAQGWHLTPAGQRLRFIYNELDLLLAECLERGLFDDLSPAEAAALATLFIYQPRGPEQEAAWPTSQLARQAARVFDLSSALAADELAAGLPPTRSPEAGFAAIAYRWATGADLEGLFGEEGAEVGDFVRNCRQLLDLLRQIRDAAPALAAPLTRALTAVDRGVVSAAGAL